MEVVVGRGHRPRAVERVRVHRSSLVLPSGMLFPVREELDLGPDVYIVHPAVCFAIAASELSLPATVEYGMGLCGSYALADEDAWHAAYDVPPLTRRDRLLANVRMLIASWDESHASGRSHRPPGLTRCLKALDFVLDRSASSMESKVATLLTLPGRLGGYGFQGLALNHRYELNSDQRAIVGGRCLVIDGWFDSARVGFEYDSDEFHGFLGPGKLERDRRRIEAAALAGVQIRSITRELLCEPERFDRFCWELRELLGMRQRTIADWTRHRRDELRAELHLAVLNYDKFARGEWQHSASFAA